MIDINKLKIYFGGGGVRLVLYVYVYGIDEVQFFNNEMLFLIVDGELNKNDN